MNELILQIVCRSNHLSPLRKSALIQNPSAQMFKDLNQHEIIDKAKKY